MTEQTVNIPLLRKAVEWAEAEAAKPSKSSAWFQAGVIVEAEQIGRDCGTCYCIAGYLAMLHVGPEVAENGGAVQYALDALGIDVAGTKGLFAYDNTIEDVRRIAEDIAGERLL